MKKIYCKHIAMVLLAFVLCLSFAACSSNSEVPPQADNRLDENGEFISPMAPKGEETHITPDLSKIKLPSPSKEETICQTEEEFAAALEAFAGPVGNEYDALSVIGAFRYDEKGDALIERLKPASEEWHKYIEENVGQKCMVDIKLSSKTPVDLNDEKVTEWVSVNGKNAEAYSNLKCIISTNYCTNTLTLSFDIVKLDGRWYLANIGTINKLQSVISKDIYI